MAQNYTGVLKPNEIFASLFNMIISQEIASDNIADGYNSLVDRAKVDGGLYGDTKLYIATDALKSHAWGNDAEATNLLAIHRPPAPKEQSIVLDTFRQIDLTIDYYLTKRAFSGEGAFAQFNSVMLGWLRDTKRIYDETTYNSFLGTHETAVGSQSQTVTLDPDNAAASTADEEAAARIAGQKLAEFLANLMIDLRKPSRAYNDYGFMRSINPSDLIVIWNSSWYNKIIKIDLPTIFHKDDIFKDLLNYDNVLPADYFGTVNSAATAGNDSTVRSLIEQDIGANHYFAGESIKTGDTAPAGTSYTESDEVICKIVQKLPPYMSAFEIGTSAFNAKSLTENHYLTWGHNTLEHLAGRPFITVKVAA